MTDDAKPVVDKLGGARAAGSKSRGQANPYRYASLDWFEVEVDAGELACETRPTIDQEPDETENDDDDRQRTEPSGGEEEEDQVEGATE